MSMPAPGRHHVGDQLIPRRSSERTSTTACATVSAAISADSISPSSMRWPRSLTWKSVRPRYSSSPPTRYRRCQRCPAPGHRCGTCAHRRSERIGHEPVRGQVGPADIPARQLDAREIQLARDTRRHRSQPGIQHVDLGVPHRGTDRHGDGVGVGHLVIGDVDRGLGRAVQVVQARPGQRAQLRDAVCTGSASPEANDVAQCAIGSGVGDVAAQRGQEDREHRRDEVHDGDALVGDQFRQIGGIAVAVRLGDHQAGTDLQRPEELPDRHVEGRRRLLQHHIVGGQTVLGAASTPAG